jgi:hypothetical protein
MGMGLVPSYKSLIGMNRLFKNKHPAVSQGNISSRLQAQRKRRPQSSQLSASSFQLSLCEHLQKPCNAGSRRKALFFNSRSNASEYKEG